MVKYPLPRRKWFSKVARKWRPWRSLPIINVCEPQYKGFSSQDIWLKTTVNQFLLHAQKKGKKRKKKKGRNLYITAKRKNNGTVTIFISVFYCAFQKHANSEVQNQKLPSQVRFSLPSIIITISSYEPWNTEKHKTDRNPPITNHKPWPFELVVVNFCFLRGPLR